MRNLMMVALIVAGILLMSAGLLGCQDDPNDGPGDQPISEETTSEPAGPSSPEDTNGGDVDSEAGGVQYESESTSVIQYSTTLPKTGGINLRL